MRGGHFVHALCRVQKTATSDEHQNLPNVAYVNEELAKKAAKGELPNIYKIKQIWVPFEED